jgi:hypothetical protein
MLMSSDDFSHGIAQAIGDAMQGMSADELRQLAVGPYLDVRAAITAEKSANVRNMVRV